MKAYLNMAGFRHILGSLLIVFCSIFMSACGGSGGGDSAPADATNSEGSSNWDALKWDKDEWS